MEECIPQVLFSQVLSLSFLNKGSTSRSIIESIEKEARRFNEILKKFPQGEGEGVAWFLVEDELSTRQDFQISNEMEKLLENYIDNSWEIDVRLIYYSPSQTLEDMIDEVEPHVYRLSLQYPLEELFCHISSSEHPLFNQALFLEGIRQFENRYTSVYIENDKLHFLPTIIRQQPASWSKQFRNFVHDYDYPAALEILSDIKYTDKVRGLEEVLLMMVDRFNFSIDSALKHLKKAKSYLGDAIILEDTKRALMPLLSNDKKTRDLARIVELFRQIDCFIEADDSPSFLVRFYRVREAILLYLLNHNYTVEQNGYTEKNYKGTFYKLFDELEEKYMSWELDGNYGAYFYIKSTNVANTLNSRNKSFLGHSRKPIDKNRLWRSYYGTGRTTLEKAKKRFSMDSALMLRDLGVVEDENIQKINRYLLLLATEIEKEAVQHDA